MGRSTVVRPMRRAVLRAKSTAQTLTLGWHARTSERVVTLESVRRRLEFFVAALHGRSIAIEAVDARTDPGWFRRHVLHLPEQQEVSKALPATDGERIFLPRALSTKRGTERALAHYRLLA